MAESSLTGCIVVLCGIPASGKSTLSENLYFHLTNRPKSSANFHVLPICYDKILTPALEEQLIQEQKVHKSDLSLEELQTHGGSSAWKSHRNMIVSCVDCLIDSIANKTVAKQPSEVPDGLLETFTSSLKTTWPLPMDLSPGCVAVVIDDNMYYSSMRYQYYQLARKYSLGYCQVFVKCDTEVAQRRNIQREEKILSHVIEEMSKKMEPPDPDQNKWESNSVTIDTETDFQLDTVLALMLKASQNPVQPIEEVDVVAQEESRQICSENQLHQIDQILRKIVTAHIKISKGPLSNKDLKAFAPMVNSNKTLIHKSLKEGLLRIPTHLLDHVYEASKDTNNPLFIYMEKVFKEHMDKESIFKANPL